jgi:hypothetical protein
MGIRDLPRERPEQGPAIELTRKMSRIHAPHVEGHFGADASDTLLCAAVYLGMFENRLMNASKLADMSGCRARPWISRSSNGSAESSKGARPEHEFSRKIKAKGPVDVQTE